MELMEHQKEAIRHLKSGSILWGGVGVGKSATVLGYYIEKQFPKNIYIITTAKKRDSLDWLRDAAGFALSNEPAFSLGGVRVVVDSWNNIEKYLDIKDAFFVFDEQRVVGHGAWVKAFIKIARVNEWVMCSATPGDTWMDYAPVFVANGFFKNITDFKRKHVLYEPFVKFPMIKGYLNEFKLQMLRNEILVEMPYDRHTERSINWIDVSYDQAKFDKIYKDRWNVFENKPVIDVAEMFRLLRRVVNSSDDRLDMVLDLMKAHDRLIIFYNFDYELELLRTLELVCPVYEYNGHRKHPVPETDKWVYLVQYMAGAEAWNCTTTDAMILYSLTYSFKMFEQAMGRIDRLDTPYTKLYYYLFMSNTFVDRGIKRSLEKKEDFNEKRFWREVDQNDDCSTEDGVPCLGSCRI